MERGSVLKVAQVSINASYSSKEPKAPERSKVELKKSMSVVDVSSIHVHAKLCFTNVLQDSRPKRHILCRLERKL